MNAQTKEARTYMGMEVESKGPLAVIDAPATPPMLLQQAVAAGNTELAGKLMDLMERWDRNQARKAFDAAMAKAKAELPVITKNRAVDFTSAKGRTNYQYEDLAEIITISAPILARQGLFSRFRTQQGDANVTVDLHRVARSGPLRGKLVDGADRSERQQEPYSSHWFERHLFAAVHSKGCSRLGGVD